MPRPPDHYTHAQFEQVESDFQGETVRCIHCKQWTGSLKTLNRKKDHLLKCTAYAAWREAGNGQEIPGPNKYSRRENTSLSMNDNDQYSSPYGDGAQQGPQFTPLMSSKRAFDVSQYFDEFWDDTSSQKCMRARCRYCGFLRAKNSTRQFEHLQQCHEFLNSAEGTQAVAEGQMQGMPADGSGSGARGDIFRGRAPNTNFMVNRPANKSRLSGGRPTTTPTRPTPSAPKPSLVNHLLAKNRVAVEQATQLQFLSHAGCGTLSKPALQQWLTQQGHMSRSLCTFIGSLIGKIRLSDSKTPNLDTSWRALDLLVSTINNAKRELEFLRTTQVKYDLQGDQDVPKHATKGFIDLFSSVASPVASLLEGMVVLWAVEYLYNLSWQYADGFHQPGPSALTSYSQPSYFQPGQYDMPNAYGQPQSNNNPDRMATAALHEALIPNWTSTGFSKFVDACKSIVDELANAQTSGNGAHELGNCELVFGQVLWLWKQMWPEVTGMGEETDQAEEVEGPSQANENGNRSDDPIEIPEDEDMDRDEDAPAADSPYGGTGLGAVAAATRAP